MKTLELKMTNDTCVSLTVRNGIWDAFSEIASKMEVDTLNLIEEVLIEFIVSVHPGL